MEGVLRLIWEPKIDTGLPNVLLFAVTHEVHCVSDLALLLDVK
jgi:hypothetical protein